MSYEPTNWKDGDLVTSAKLNKLEQGVAGGANILFVGKTTEDDVTILDKTWQEIHDADLALIISTEGGDKTISIVSQIFADDEQEDSYYSVITSDEIEYAADSPSDYPTAEDNLK